MRRIGLSMGCVVMALSLCLIGCEKQDAEAPKTAEVKAESSADEPKTPEPAAPSGVHSVHPVGGVSPHGKPSGAQRPMPGLPAGHPPVGAAHGSRAAKAPFAPMAGKKAVAAEDGHEMPLPLVGPGSVDELKARLAKLPEDGDLRTNIEKAFRLTFSSDRSKRDVGQAAKLLKPTLSNPAAAPTAERILGYVAVSSGFNVPEAFKHYGQAITLEPGYGEAHYALAFLHAMKDRETGKKHYEKALALGVPDVRGLSRFYGDGAAAKAQGQPGANPHGGQAPSGGK